MNKRFIIPLIILTLVCSMSLIPISTLAKDNKITLPTTLAVTRPVYANAGELDVVIRERDNSKYEGGIIEVDAYENVTFFYYYTGGDNTSAPLLFGDDGTYISTSLSWVDGTLMTYDNDSTVILGGGVNAYYNYTLNMSSEFVTFRSRYGEFEDAIGVPNLITTGVWIESDFKQEFYTQYDEIDMNITAHNYNVTSYGLTYREVIPGHTGEFQNVSVSDTRVGGYANFTASFTHSFEADTQVEVRAFIYHFDNITKEFRYLYENKAHVITIVDGTPEMELSVPQFTNSLNVSLYWNASVLSAFITSVEIDWDDLSSIETVNNLSIHRIYHQYSSVGEYNISVTANASLATKTESVVVLIEQTAPSGSILIEETDGSLLNPELLNVTSIERSLKEIKFIIEANDTGGSGLYKIVVSTDEGNSISLPGSGEIVMSFLDYGIHKIILTIHDNAGNIREKSFFIDLVKSPIPTDSAIPFPFGILSIFGLIAIALLYKKKRN